jgi:nicotinate phosphoribosyltransferase
MLAPLAILDVVREHARAELARLPEPLRALEDADPYPVEIAPALRELADQIDAYT